MNKFFAYLAGIAGGITGIFLSYPVTCHFITEGMVYSLVGHLIILFLLGFHALLLGTFGSVMGYQLVRLLLPDLTDQVDSSH
ncbi:MAG: hypothetical protein VYE64_00585 [Planctomycetota bacterium]|nr:hypothetical protein [Planctomycetota bacterium]